MLNAHIHEERPWGNFEVFTLNEQSSVKIISVHANMRLSLQRHAKRSEYWKVIEGSGSATVADTERLVGVGDEILIAVGALHRLTGGPEGIRVLEIALGTFDENDIERVEDDFGRVSQPEV